MKNKLSYIIAGLALLFFSCSDDGEEQKEEESGLGTLEVIAIYEGGITVPDVVITTIPETTERITDDTGKAVFSNIPVGNYQIVLVPPFSDVDVTVSVEVEKDQADTIEVIVGPEPISEEPVDIDLLLDSIYGQLKSEFLFDANGYSHYWGDIGTGMVRINPTSMGRFGDLDNYIFNLGDYVIGEVWSEHYRVIRLTNIGLDALSDSNFIAESNADPIVLESEIRFLRAILYFNLVKLYGNPILVTTAKIDIDNPPTHVQGRVAVYDQIIEDLKFAQQNLASSLSNEKASLEAATALLGKVYLTMAGFPLAQSDKYGLALQELEKLTESYTLEDDYADIFAIENENLNTEVIFKIGYNGSGNYGVPWGPVGISFNDRFLLVEEFIDSFFEEGSEPSEPVIFPVNTDDTRFYQNIATFSYQSGQSVNETSRNDWRPYKFIKDVVGPSVANEESFDYPYLRMADVYLMIAEAENAINGPTTKAQNALNLVRRRAFKDLNHDVQPELSQEAFFNVILEERRLEFCFEGQFKDDLIRMNALEAEILNYNQNYPGLAKDLQSHEYIWPIPQSEMILNPNVDQNEGY